MIEMRILKEVGVGLQQDNVQVIIEGIIEVAAVDQDQVQE